MQKAKIALYIPIIIFSAWFLLRGETIVTPAFFFPIGVLTAAGMALLQGYLPGDHKKFSLSVAIGLIGLLPNEDEQGYLLYMHLFISSVIFAGAFIWLFKERLRPAVNAYTVILWSILFVYLVYQKIGISPVAIVLFGIPSAITFLNGFIDLDKGLPMKVFFYVWFLVITLGVMMLTYTFSNLDLFWLYSFTDTSTLTVVGMLVSGIAFFHIMTNLLFLLRLVPLQKEHETFRQALERSKEHARFLASGYVWRKGMSLLPLIATFCIAIMLALNAATGTVADVFVMAIVVALIPWIQEPAELSSSSEGEKLAKA